MFIHRLRFASIFIVYCLTTLTNGATLPDYEVKALHLISSILGADWNSTIDPCSRDNSCDLTRNYLSGPIPPEWGSSTRLVRIILDNNGLSGTLPEALGNLSKIERLHLSSNYFTGKIPETFARLTSLKAFRISDNNFTGQIPDFIFRNWTNLEE
ncbi:hypothetical protein Gotur_011057, partial [Gossypium turneri]